MAGIYILAFSSEPSLISLDCPKKPKWLARHGKMVCARGKMTCASRQNDLRSWQNDYARHFGCNGPPWENDLRIDLRLGLRVDLRHKAGCACSAAQVIFHLIRAQAIGPSLGGSH